MTGSAHLIQGNATAIPLATGSVHCAVTSPPYWGLRDYGHGEGQNWPSVEYRTIGGAVTVPAMRCPLGLEPTPESFIGHMVLVFREIGRVLRDDGTCWLNIGDSYATGGKGGGGSFMAERRDGAWQKRSAVNGWRSAPPGLKDKDLVGIPWMLAFALRTDGWYLRQDIIWAKPNPMPESTRDRCTKAHEYLFLLTKRPRYYFDPAGIAEAAAGQTPGNTTHKYTAAAGSDQRHRTKAGLLSIGGRPQFIRAQQLAAQAGLTPEHLDAIRICGITDTGKTATTQTGTGKNDPRQINLAAEAKAALGGYYREFLLAPTRNRRSVWTIGTESCREAHFATFPTKLVTPCILAGTSAKGCCPACGAQWHRVVEKVREATRPGTESKAFGGPGSRFNVSRDPAHPTELDGKVTGYRDPGRHVSRVVGEVWMPGCKCPTAAPVPCRVFDAFSGSGTTAITAGHLGRIGIGLELSAPYNAIAAVRREKPARPASRPRQHRPAAAPTNPLTLFPVEAA